MEENKYIGKKYNRYTVLEKISGTKQIYKCQCDCGTIKNVDISKLKDGEIKSCGCYRNQLLKYGRTTHGFKHTRLYGIWAGAKNRCTNPNNPDYPDYGGRGITMCDEWANDFMTFRAWAINNGYNDKLSIDRIDNMSGYNPDNCRWATMKQQNRNRRGVIIVEIFGITKPVIQWCELLNISINSVRHRAYKGQSYYGSILHYVGEADLMDFCNQLKNDKTNKKAG